MQELVIGPGPRDGSWWPCVACHTVPNFTSGPHLAPYPLSRFSRAVPSHLLALLHGVSRFIRIFAPGDVTLSCPDKSVEPSEGRKRKEPEVGGKEQRVRREIRDGRRVLSRAFREAKPGKEEADKNFSN